jgi:hypothetical protein
MQTNVDSGQESNEPIFLRTLRWAFSNPDKIAALGFGFVAFGLAIRYFDSQKEKQLSQDNSSNLRKIRKINDS